MYEGGGTYTGTGTYKFSTIFPLTEGGQRDCGKPNDAGGRIELKATSPTIRYRTTIYANQHRYESPKSRPEVIEAEASTYRKQRQWREIR